MINKSATKACEIAWANGNATVLVLGDMTDVSSREHVSIQLEAMDALLHTARGFNADAAH